MNPFKALFVAAAATQIACVPIAMALVLPSQPKPFQGMAQDDPASASHLAKESSRTMPAAGPAPLSSVMDALLKMGCTISASDSTHGVVTFERIQGEPSSPAVHKGLGYDSAITTGTIKLSPEPNGFACALVLTGKINWRTPDRGIGAEVIPRLSPADHKRFLDELFSKM